MDSHNERAKKILASTEQICTPEQVQAAVAKIAAELNDRFNNLEPGSFPLFLGVMGGAVVFSGQLLPHLTFPLEFDFIHVSRYGNEDHGSEVIWKVIPRQNVMNRVIVVLDDILDEGETLAHVQRRLLDMGAAKVLLAVFADKQLGAKKPVTPDHIGMTLPNKFVIGFGMDIEGYWRNLPDIRALTVDPLVI
ncbi:MAG: hypoxanthine-guanine phosphoribosyltransferase [Burkholderiaceae bacterium]|jgi:hypoxanthine phosphoribosyltransferase|nr:hypoxanthine-guanine phosphoribosyltransferase [Burkholderiaceae bacterium]